jgi:hypothetical protein
MTTQDAPLEPPVRGQLRPAEQRREVRAIQRHELGVTAGAVGVGEELPVGAVGAGALPRAAGGQGPAAATRRVWSWPPTSSWRWPRSVRAPDPGADAGGLLALAGLALLGCLLVARIVDADIGAPAVIAALLGAGLLRHRRLRGRRPGDLDRVGAFAHAGSDDVLPGAGVLALTPRPPVLVTGRASPGCRHRDGSPTDASGWPRSRTGRTNPVAMRHERCRRRWCCRRRSPGAARAPRPGTSRASAGSPRPRRTAAEPPRRRRIPRAGLRSLGLRARTADGELAGAVGSVAPEDFRTAHAVVVQLRARVQSAVGKLLLPHRPATWPSSCAPTPSASSRRSWRSCARGQPAVSPRSARGQRGPAVRVCTAATAARAEVNAPCCHDSAFER